MIKSQYKLDNSFNYDNIHVNSNYMSFLSSHDMSYLIRNIVEYDSCVKVQTECVIHKLNTNLFGVYYIMFNIYKKYNMDYIDLYLETIPFFTMDNSINIFEKVKSLESEILNSYQDEINIHKILEK